MASKSAGNLSSLLTHLRHVESSLTRVLMEATLKLTSLTDVGVFVLFDTAEGRLFGGSDSFVDAFLEGRLEPGNEGRRVTTRLDEASLETSAETTGCTKNEISDSGREAPRQRSTTQPAFLPLLSKGPSPSRKRSSLSPTRSTSPLKRVKMAPLSRTEGGLPLMDPGPAVKEEIVVLDDVDAEDPSDSPTVDSVASPSVTVHSGPMFSGVLSSSAFDDDWDDDIEEIIYDLDVDPTLPEVKPSVSDATSTMPVFPCRLPEFVDVSTLPSTSLSDAPLHVDSSGALIERQFAAPCPALDDHLDAVIRRHAPIVCTANVASVPSTPVHPFNVKPDDVSTDLDQLRPMMKLLQESQTAISLQKLEVLALQPVDEMFTRGTPAYALLKSCLYSQGKILSQLCPFKTDIKDPNVKSFFNTYVEAVVLICPSNLRNCYFSENPLWLVDLLTSESKRNSKVSVTAFIKDQARNGFKAEFKTKRALLGKL